MKLFFNEKEVDPQELYGEGFYYLASPYSKYPGGIEVAFEEICRIAGWFVMHKIAIYCPIAHTHPIAVNAMLDPLDHHIWLPADKPFMDAAKGLIIAEMPTWTESYGIQVETERFVALHKPIFYLRGIE